jgi:murein DD-endopeptidase MepM/ murein hydrolase activator NlpD
MTYPADKKTRRGMPLAVLLIALLILGAAVAVGVRLFEGELPKVVLAEKPDFLGNKKTITLSASDAKSGLQGLVVDLVQGEKKAVLYQKEIVRQGYFAHSGPNLLDATVEVDPKSLGFADGKAELAVTARDFSWRNWMGGNVTTLTVPVVIDTRPPQLAVKDSTRYIKNGGTGVVVYQTDEPLSKSGVTINDHFNPGYPLAGRGENTYVAYVAVPFNAKSITSSYVSAVDRAGNEAQAAVGMIFKRKALKPDRINISDSFLTAKLPAFLLHYQLAGTPVKQYVTLNSKIRQENNRKIKEICSKSASERLWKGVFSRMARSSRRSSFADDRSYYYKGKKIDEEYHLGVDLASVRHAQVEAANRGRVVFTGYLGLYGNAVIVDHGQGVFTLYGHLSQIKVKPGDLVEHDGLLGLSGATGMAGGDHLHFSILVNGIFVDPVEWWDAHWLQVNIEDIL